MFLVDVSPSMGNTREVEVPQPNGEVHLIEMTNLEWALQFVKLKVQEMVMYYLLLTTGFMNALPDLQRAQNGPVWCHFVRYGR